MEITEAITKSFDLNADELALVLPYFVLSEFRKGTHFLTEGQPVDRLGFIQKGITREYLFANGKEITKYIGTPGSFISDVSGIQLIPRQGGASRP